jgi:hypothetical protein
MRAFVTDEVAKVYRAGGRRFFSKKAAFHAAARAIIKKRCDCEMGDSITPGITCRYHEPEHYPVVAARLARFVARAYAQAERVTP